jgi:hypothetical protein
MKENRQRAAPSSSFEEDLGIGMNAHTGLVAGHNATGWVRKEPKGKRNRK